MSALFTRSASKSTKTKLYHSPGSFVSAFLKCLLFLSLPFILSARVSAQTFAKITVDDEDTFSRGVSWIDYDNDGDLDLFLSNADFSDLSKSQNKIYRNDGDDTFVLLRPGDVATDTSLTLGVSWADFDNDGDLDFFNANPNSIYETAFDQSTLLGSALFENQGAPDYMFSRIVSGDMNGNNKINGFGSAWADYDNDGYVDLFVATPRGSAYPEEDTLTNVLFDNNTDGTFTRNRESVVVNGPIDFYTIPTWSDYDQDGDMDLFVTNGPVQNGVLQPDYFYRNMLKETGTATFERDLSSSFAVDPRDGQQANWVDFDNDGDLDVYITNFGGTPAVTGGMANDMYQNFGGTFIKSVSGPHVTDVKVSLGQTWGDFDNDGDLDLYVTNLTTQNSAGGNNYYSNEGPPLYEFSSVELGDLVAIRRAGWGATAGDYDNDGDLDLYVTFNTLVAGAAPDALFKNDTENSNNWFNVRCVGMQSNRAAIGARVRIKATIFGNSYWQLREISSQNASTGHNSLRTHFGLGDATTVDSLIVEWPSGVVDVATGLQPNQFVEVLEGNSVTSVEDRQPTVPTGFELRQNFPNPFNPSTTIEYTLPRSSQVSLKIFNLSGQVVRNLASGIQSEGIHSVVWNGLNDREEEVASGLYVYKLATEGFSETRKMLFLK